MDEILTNKSTSISDFKANPNRELKLAGDEPFAVLTNNRPTFYVLSPKAYDDLLEKIWELEIAPEVRAALAEEGRIKVDIKDLKEGESILIAEGE